MRSSSWESEVANSTGLCSTRAGVGVDVPGGVAADAGVHGVAGYGGGGEDLVAAEVVAGERGTEVGGDSGTGVDMLSGRELPTPPAPLKWTYSTVKLSYVGVEPSSTAVPCPSSPFVEHYVTRRVHMLCPWVKNAVGFRALRVADEHPRDASGEREAAEDP
jgi:hypothetical protein